MPRIIISGEMAADHGDGFADGVHVGALQADAAAGALAARLRGGLAAEHQHQVLAHRAEGACAARR